MRQDGGGRAATRLPAWGYFVVSAVFHYLGPAFAVLLFAHLDVLAVAWLRNASAAAIFAVWRRPWRALRGMTGRQRYALLGLGAVLAAMNASFYLAIDRLPLGTVGAIEMLGTVGLATLGVRSRRNLAALVLVSTGALLLADLHLGGQPLGVVLAFANCACFVLYVILGHRIAQGGGAAALDRLGIALLVATVALTPFCLSRALPALQAPGLVAAGIGVGVCSSVIPYICDQLAMARLKRATFALMLGLLPAFGTVIGAIVLHQVPGWIEVSGIALVIGGVAVHQDGQRERERA